MIEKINLLRGHLFLLGKVKLGLLFLIFFFLEMNFPKVFSVSCNFFFILFFFLCLYRERHIFLVGIFFGFLRDLISISKFPLNTIIFGCWSYFLPKIFRRFYKENILLQISILILCVWVNSLIFFFFRRTISIPVFLNIAFLESLYQVSVFLVLFRFLKRCIQS